jgi:hypothetical protein
VASVAFQEYVEASTVEAWAVFKEIQSKAEMENRNIRYMIGSFTSRDLQSKPASIPPHGAYNAAMNVFAARA